MHCANRSDSNNGVANLRMVSIHWLEPGFELGSLPPRCNCPAILDVLKKFDSSDRGFEVFFFPGSIINIARKCKCGGSKPHGFSRESSLLAHVDPSGGDRGALYNLLFI